MRCPIQYNSLGLLVTLSLLALFAASPTIAQDISKYYTVMHPEEFDIDWAAFYQNADKATAKVRERIPNHLDLAYGDHPKQRLDLYLPVEKSENAPILVFFHGGGFREGDKAHYGYIADPFSKHGVIVAVVGYRYLTDLTSPPQSDEAWSDDAKNAIAWLYNHIEDYGGERNAMYLAGHSTGAAIVTYLGTNRSWLSELGIPTRLVKGIVRVSGGGGGAGSTPAHQAAAKLRINDPVPAAVITYGTKETSTHMQPAQRAAAKLSGVGADVSFFYLASQDHADTVLSLGDEKSLLFRSAMKMITRERGRY